MFKLKLISAAEDHRKFIGKSFTYNKITYKIISYDPLDKFFLLQGSQGLYSKTFYTDLAAGKIKIVEDVGV